MDFPTLERMAAHLEPLPKGLDTVEQAAFLSLRALYREFRAGAIDRDTAKAEKHAIHGAYEQGKFQLRASQQDAEIRNRFSHVFDAMNKSDCPLCRRAAAIYDGRCRE